MEQAGQYIEENVPFLSGQVRGDWTLGATNNPMLAAAAEVFSPADVIPMSKVAPAVFLGAKAAKRALDMGDPSVMRAFGVAEAMEKAGKTPDNIWAATAEHFRRADRPYAGVMRDAEGNLKFELPDPSLEQANFDINANTLGGAIQNPDLYNLIPGLRGYGFEKLPDDSLGYGAFSQQGRAIPALKVREFERTPGEQYSTALHETQHALDRAEGAHYGSSMDWYEMPEGLADRFEEFKAALANAELAGKEIPGDIKQDLQILDLYRNLAPRDRFDLYQSTPGESMARLVQDRMERGFGLESSRQNPPRFDVPIEVQMEAGSMPTFDDVWGVFVQDLMRLNKDLDLGL
jgi:hypothetical protein